MAPLMSAAGFQAFEDPGSVVNPLIYIVIILVFTGLILLVIKFGKKWIIHGFILFAVGATTYYVLIALLEPVLGLTIGGITSIAVALGLTGLLYVYPEWYVIDALGVVIGAGAAAIFGISLSILPALVLLVALAVYDAISVYRTKHMITLAEGVMELRAPILFVIPRTLRYSFRKADLSKMTSEEGERDAFFMGLGDAVMPTILIVSAIAFNPAAPVLLWVNLPALGALLGSLVGFAVLMLLVMTGKPQAGLPLLNSGTIIGYLAGVLAAGAPILV